jgi:adenylosuccinate synthase
MSANLVVGAQWGDEGKAKVIDYLSKDIDIIVRYQGGANAGHTVVVGGKKYVFHLVPSGIIYPKSQCIIGNGVVLDPNFFLKECDSIEAAGFPVFDRIFISDSCHLILPFHQKLDELKETHCAPGEKIGTTKRGIGICYADKMLRTGLRAGDLLNEKDFKTKLASIVKNKNYELEKLYREKPFNYEEILDSLMEFKRRTSKFIINTSYHLNQQLKLGKKVLLEGAQGTGLDIDFGTYPFVTSSNPSVGGAISGSGINFRYLDKVYGIAKAYTTRVGEGPFPTELLGEDGEKLRQLGGEFGATTGRPRRCGWFDVELLKHAVRVNGMSDLVLTKIDILSNYAKIPVAVGYELNGNRLDYFPMNCLDSVTPIYEELPGWNVSIQGIGNFSDLPQKCKEYISFLEENIGVPISIISTGPDRKDTIIR